MNKNDLVATVASQADLSKSDATRAVDCVFDAITDSLKSGTEVRLVGFGTFSVKHRNQRIGRNPKTGKSIQINKKYHPYFRSSKLLKETLNK